MKQWLLVLASLLLLSFFMVGCSDDDEDCPACPSTEDEVTPKGFVTGSVYLIPEAYFEYIYIYGYGAIPPNIDSMKVGDSLLFGDDFFDYNYDEDYHDNYWTVYFDEDGGSYMYEHGDMATVMFYGNGMSSTCTFKILDADSAEANIVSPLHDGDTLSSDADSSTIIWDRAYDADYYSIWLEFCCGYGYDYTNKYYYTTDTTFKLTSAMLPDSLRYVYVMVTPFTGPNPQTGASNITGDYLTGKIYSFGWNDYIRIYGWYPAPTPKAVGDVNIEEPPRKELSPAQIIENTYKQYK